MSAEEQKNLDETLEFIRDVNKTISQTKRILAYPELLTKEELLIVLGSMTSAMETLFNAMQMHMEIAQVITTHDGPTPE